MTKYLAGVLSVIAVGVLLIAYGLLVPRAAVEARTGVVTAMPMPGGEQVVMQDTPSQPRLAYPVRTSLNQPYFPEPGAYESLQPRAVVDDVRPERVIYRPAAPRRTSVRTVEKPRRNWKKTAAVIGGSSAAAAGLGAIIGGRKGALIGAAIGGGAGTLYEVTRK